MVRTLLPNNKVVCHKYITIEQWLHIISQYLYALLVNNKKKMRVALKSLQARWFSIKLHTHLIAHENNHTKTPIVILHGLLGSGLNYTTLFKKEAADPHGILWHRKAYIPDARNHGASAHHPSHLYSDLCNDLLHLLDENKIQECILIAHSMGAKQAMHFACCIRIV